MVKETKTNYEMIYLENLPSIATKLASISE